MIRKIKKGNDDMFLCFCGKRFQYPQSLLRHGRNCIGDSLENNKGLNIGISRFKDSIYENGVSMEEQNGVTTKEQSEVMTEEQSGVMTEEQSGVTTEEQNGVAVAELTDCIGIYTLEYYANGRGQELESN